MFYIELGSGDLERNQMQALPQGVTVWLGRWTVTQ